MNLYFKAFESYRLTDRQTDRHDRNYIPRRFAGGQRHEAAGAKFITRNKRHVKKTAAQTSPSQITDRL